MINKTNKQLFSYLDNSPSCYHAIKNGAEYLQTKGYKELKESQKWNIQKGDKFYVIRNNSSIIAVEMPESDFVGFNMVSSHSDSPVFKVKELSHMKVEGNYTKLNTEVYGGLIMSTWCDRPLSIAGRVLVKTEKGIKTVLVNIDRDLCIIPNLAIHMQREINNGYKYNPQVDMLPVLGDENADLFQVIEAECGVKKEDIISTDLFLYPRIKGTVFGAKGEFIGSPRLDDLQCAFSSLKAIGESEKSDSVKICAVFDNEEVGSRTKQGADSTFLFDVLSRINASQGKTEEDLRIAIANSFMVSADNAHGVHPNYAEKTDPTNRNYLNKGIVIKFNSNQKYTTDGVSASIFKTICDKNNVPYQIFHNRSDMPGGGTLGNISNSHISLNTVDIGIPQFSMHSAFETAGAMDTEHMVNALKGVYESTIVETNVGEYEIK